MPTVEIDERSGFCHGVVSAIAKAEAELAAGNGAPLYCLGDIVHNSNEVERLEAKGLRTVTHADVNNLRGVKLLLRAHGEPPSTYALARRNGIELIDATCPVVLRLQQRIKATYTTAPAGTQILIYGKPGHAEVNGLVGQTDGTAIVIQQPSDLHSGAIDFSRPIELYSQTTKPLEGFREIIAEIERCKAPGVPFHSYDTICRQVQGRVDHLRGFAAAHDAVLFVSGEKSSNGRVLCEHCRQVNPATYLVSGPSQVDAAWLVGKQSIGVCGATSTPRWLMEQVRERAMQLIDTQQ